MQTQNRKLQFIFLMRIALVGAALNFSALQSIPVTGFFHLAPTSEVQVATAQWEFDQAIAQLNQRQAIFLRGGAYDKNALIQAVQKVSSLTPASREQFLNGRKALSWWRFYCQENDDLRSAIEIDQALSQLEENFTATIPPDLMAQKPRDDPVWVKEAWDAAMDGEKVPLQQQELYRWITGKFHTKKINTWLMDNGVLVKALHIVHGVSFKDLREAFQIPSGFYVEILPKGYGAFKYVLQVRVAVKGKHYHLALKGFKPMETSLGMNQEIATLNMLHGYGVPVVGLATQTDHL